jgi:PAS domain S-box-containing protein
VDDPRFAFLQGKSAMGALVRGKDWSRTPLGDPKGWSQSLRSAASICLGSEFPVAIYWGPELVLLYNDAWIPLLGEKHPWVLGLPARGVWPEIWGTIRRLLDQVMTTGEATRSKDQLLAVRRQGYTEECYFDYTFSPIRGDGGEVEGIFNAVMETTDRVVGERRLLTLRELAGNVAEARSVDLACHATGRTLMRASADIPFALLYLLSRDGTEARLTEAVGLEAGTAASPLKISIQGPDWEIARVVQTGEAQLLENLETTVSSLPGGPWPEAPGSALAIPIARAGSARPCGVLVAGISPRRALDAEYRNFLEIATGHISQAFANAEAYEQERKHAESLVASNVATRVAAPSMEPRPTKTQRILLADDNVEMREFVRGLLTKSGYQVEAVADGVSALNVARTHQPDLVLADVMLPALDGFEVLRELRAEPKLSDVPVILLSPRDSEEAPIEGVQAGADDYLSKPFSARELLVRVESHLKMARFRRESAEAMSFRAAQFETLFNQAPLGVYVVDADFRISEVNPVAWPVFRDIPGGVLGRDFDEVVHILWEKAFSDEVVARFRHTLDTGESYVAPGQAEYRMDREVTEYYEWRLDRIVLPEGRFGVVCYFQDVSERHNAEQTANLLAAIVASSDDAIVSKNLNGVIMSWNRGAERVFGYNADEAVGQPIIILIPPDRLEEERTILDRLKRGERVEHFETVRVRKDGSVLNVSLTVSPVKDAQGRIVGASKVARDITERVIHEKALQEANIALKRANADLQQFAYSASHDLQEPLRMVATYSALLREDFGDKLGATGEEYIQHAIRAAMRMENLLRDLRIYTQVSTAENESQEEIETSEVLNKTLLNLEVAIEESGATIEVSPLPRLRLHEFQVTQIFQNLIGNAIRYRSERPLHISIAVERKGEEWLFSVRDNGIGIEPQFKALIFGIFKRLHSAYEHPGTGMGLAICQRVVERVGGRIWVESEVGVGSTFYFTIPCGAPRRSVEPGVTAK